MYSLSIWKTMWFFLNTDLSSQGFQKLISLYGVLDTIKLSKTMSGSLSFGSISLFNRLYNCILGSSNPRMFLSPLGSMNDTRCLLPSFTHKIKSG